MSALDHAFIRAYTLDTAPVAGAAVMPRAAIPFAAPFAPPQPFAPPAPLAPLLVGPSIEPAPYASLHNPVQPVVPAPHFRLTSFVHSATTLEPPAVEPAVVEYELDPTDFASLPPATPSFQPVVQLPQVPTFGPAEPIAPLADPNAPSAAFEVDRFIWPEMCESIMQQCGAELDQLAGELISESEAGRKVVAITGSRRGDGRSTLAMLLARRVAAAGAKVCLVDADFEVPQLAARLGMTIDTGWEKVIADCLDLWDGLIESVGDRLTLLPLAPRPAPNSALPPAAEFAGTHAEAIAGHFEILRKHFDVVIVDAGPMKAIRADGKPRGPLAMAKCLDTAILVSDARLSSPGRITELHRRLADSGLPPLGIAENFCPLN